MRPQRPSTVKSLTPPRTGCHPRALADISKFQKRVVTELRRSSRSFVSDPSGRTGSSSFNSRRKEKTFSAEEPGSTAAEDDPSKEGLVASLLRDLIKDLSLKGPGEDEEMKAAVLRQVDVLPDFHLHCDKDPRWALALLQASHPQELQVSGVRQEHLATVQDMTNLRGLVLGGDLKYLPRDTAVLMPQPSKNGSPYGLNRLKVARLPRQTLVSLLQVHGHSLQELELVVGTPGNVGWPWTGEDLHDVLKRCRLQALQTLKLVRTGCHHTYAACWTQLKAVRGVMPRAAAVLCDLCEKVSLEEMLSTAVEQCDRDFIEVLIHKGWKPDQFDKAGETALHYAAERGDLYGIKLLLEHSAKVESMCQNGKTALHHAAMYGVTPVVEFLIAEKADLHARTKKGETALHLAAMFGKIEVVKLLLDRGVDGTITTKDGRCALDYARDSMWRNAKLVELLESREYKNEALENKRERKPGKTPVNKKRGAQGRTGDPTAPAGGAAGGPLPRPTAAFRGPFASRPGPSWACSPGGKRHPARPGQSAPGDVNKRGQNAQNSYVML